MSARSGQYWMVMANNIFLLFSEKNDDVGGTSK